MIRRLIVSSVAAAVIASAAWAETPGIVCPDPGSDRQAEVVPFVAGLGYTVTARVRTGHPGDPWSLTIAEDVDAATVASIESALATEFGQ